MAESTEEQPLLVQMDDEAVKSSGQDSKSLTTTTTTIVTAAPTTTTAKRQRTIADMFAGNKTSASSEPSAKKMKLTSTGDISASGSNLNKIEVQKLNSIPFSMSAFQESLSDDEKRLLKLECDVMGKSWIKMLKDEIRKPYFLSLKEFLWKEGVSWPKISPKLNVYPLPTNIYSWSNTPLGKIKVVIVGQDPYHGAGQAHGLCFSVPIGVNIPPSLRNIYLELKSEYPNFSAPGHGNLSAWAAGGVLMLNTCLTVRAGEPGSHSNKGWEQFTDKVVDIVDKYGGANLPSSGNSTGTGRGVVFLAWGAWAAKRVAKLDKNKHLILKSAHPSPFSANRGFIGNGHFKKANEWLAKKYGPDSQVDWCSFTVPAVD